MKKPTHQEMMKRPSLWYNEYLNSLKIVYPDILTQAHWFDGKIGTDGYWTDWENSTAVIRTHYEFVSWL